MTDENTISLTPIRQAGLDLEQYFGLWAVAPEQFFAMFHRVAQLNLAAHVQMNAGTKVQAAAVPATKARTAEVTIGLIEMNGTLMKRGTSLSSSSSLIQLRQVLRASARDAEIDAILLRIDSPGGTAAGTQELADEIARAREVKPVWAFVEDLAASAAYWVGSQAEKLYANTPTALVGSVGTFIGLYDYSEAAAKEGIKAIVIKAGSLKGAGFPGTEITEEQRAYWQEIVDKSQTEFTAAVSRGRNIPAAQVAEQIVTGRVYLAQDAISMGMIDGVKSFDAVIAELTERVRSGRARPNTQRSTRAMSENQTITAETTGPKAASIAELKAACPGADADFLMSQLEAGAALATAQTAWIGEQQKRLAAAEAKAAEAKAKAEAAAKAPGVDTLGSGDAKTAAGTGDAETAWNQAVETKVAAGLSRKQAVAAVVHESPDLHAAYLAAANAGRRKPA